MEINPVTALTHMRDSIHKLGFSIQYGDPTIARFLIARSMNPNKAAAMLVDWLQWRTALVPIGLVPDSEVQDELGLPVVMVRASKHCPSEDQLQFKKFVVYLLLSDKTIASSFKGEEV